MSPHLFCSIGRGRAKTLALGEGTPETSWGGMSDISDCSLEALSKRKMSWCSSLYGYKSLKFKTAGSATFPPGDSDQDWSSFTLILLRNLLGVAAEDCLMQNTCWHHWIPFASPFLEPFSHHSVGWMNTALLVSCTNRTGFILKIRTGLNYWNWTETHMSCSGSHVIGILKLFTCTWCCRSHLNGPNNDKLSFRGHYVHV